MIVNHLFLKMSSSDKIHINNLDNTIVYIYRYVILVIGILEEILEKKCLCILFSHFSFVQFRIN